MERTEPEAEACGTAVMRTYSFLFVSLVQSSYFHISFTDPELKIKL